MTNQPIHAVIGPFCQRKFSCRHHPSGMFGASKDIITSSPPCIQKRRDKFIGSAEALSQLRLMIFSDINLWQILQRYFGH